MDQIGTAAHIHAIGEGARVANRGRPDAQYSQDIVARRLCAATSVSALWHAVTNCTDTRKIADQYTGTRYGTLVSSACRREECVTPIA